MKSSIESSLGAAAPFARRTLDAEQVQEREEHDEHAGELWAQAVTELLVQRLPPTPRYDGDGAATAPLRNGGPGPADAGGSGLVAPEGAHADAQPADAQPAGAQGANAARGRAEGLDVPSQLSAEVSDERFGRLQLHVVRANEGLSIVINVADSHVKALIEAEHLSLIKTLKDAGLRVASVRIGSSAQPGTSLALDRGGTERSRAGAALSRANARRRAYPPAREEEEDPSSEGVDFTA